MSNRDNYIPILFISAHIVSVILFLIKIYGGLYGWPWELILLPFILDVIVFIMVMLTAIILCIIIFLLKLFS